MGLGWTREGLGVAIAGRALDGGRPELSPGLPHAAVPTTISSETAREIRPRRTRTNTLIWSPALSVEHPIRQLAVLECGVVRHLEVIRH